MDQSRRAQEGKAEDEESRLQKNDLVFEETGQAEANVEIAEAEVNEESLNMK